MDDRGSESPPRLLIRRPRTKANGLFDLLLLLLLLLLPLAAEEAEGDEEDWPGAGKGGKTVSRCGWEKVWLCGETRMLRG